MSHKYQHKPLDQRIARAIIEEATERAERRGEHNCLIWPDKIADDGYGVTVWGGHRAHRLAWAAKHGDPGPLMVRHEVCGNRACFDHEHLSTGTAADNNADTRRMGRHPGQSLKVFSDEMAAQAAAMVNGGLSISEVAARLNVGFGTVQRAVAPLLDPGVTPGRHARKVTDDDVLTARYDLAAGRATIADIRKRLGISWPAAQKMVQGRTYTHVGGPRAPLASRATRESVAEGLRTLTD